jgi:hypothetical protein
MRSACSTTSVGALTYGVTVALIGPVVTATTVARTGSTVTMQPVRMPRARRGVADDGGDAELAGRDGGVGDEAAVSP